VGVNKKELYHASPTRLQELNRENLASRGNSALRLLLPAEERGRGHDRLKKKQGRSRFPENAVSASQRVEEGF